VNPGVSESQDDRPKEPALNERLLDLFVFVPAGIVATAIDELPKLAARGREQLGVHVSSARAVGHYAVRSGRRRLEQGPAGLFFTREATRPGPRRVVRPVPGGTAAPGERSGADTARSWSNGHVPSASTLSIPGFDSLSASQVVQRLDGLTREELVSVRAYESATRGRRTILNRVDQLLDERS
jgi:hypothetical protein